MQKRSPFIALLLFVLLAATVLEAQQMKIVRRGPGGDKTQTFNQDDLLMVPELAAVILAQDKEIVIDHIMEPEMRLKGHETTEAKEGDKVLMADGKRLTSIKELRALYEKAAPGATVKLGIRRGEEMVMASFVKADPKDLPKGRMMISTGGDDKDLMVVGGAGLFLTMKGKEIVVDKIISEDLPKGADAHEGDVVTAVNGTSVKNLDELRANLGKAAAGSEVSLTLKRGSATSSVKYTKPKDEGRVVVRRRGN
jgi:S1-C subfamily serine protease